MKKLYSFLIVFALVLMSSGPVFAEELGTDENGNLDHSTADTTITYDQAPEFTVYIPETIELVRDQGALTATASDEVALAAGSILPDVGIEVSLSEINDFTAFGITMPVRAYLGEIVDSTKEVAESDAVLTKVPDGVITQEIVQPITFQTSGIFAAGSFSTTATF